MINIFKALEVFERRLELVILQFARFPSLSGDAEQACVTPLTDREARKLAI
jgi:hypothetical protein